VGAAQGHRVVLVQVGVVAHDVDLESVRLGRFRSEKSETQEVKQSSLNSVNLKSKTWPFYIEEKIDLKGKTV